MIKGNAGPEQEKSGAIVCFAPNGKDELLRINLSHVGIVSIGETKPEAAADSVKRLQVEMYVEEMSFVMNAGGV